MHAGQMGDVVNTAAVTADEPDPHLTNDLAVARATVAAPQSQPGGNDQTGGGTQTGPSDQTGGTRCNGTIALTTSARTVVRVHGKKTTRTRTVTFGSARYKLAAGKKATVIVKLYPSARALLARSRKLTATLAVRLGTNPKARPVAQPKLVLRAQGAPRR